jgi:hypothetical protein
MLTEDEYDRASAGGIAVEAARLMFGETVFQTKPRSAHII